MSTTWTILKTLLFSSIMLADAVLGALVYSSRPSKHTYGGETAGVALASSVLRALGHLAFIISQFGGIATAEGFRELRKTVYTALDVLAADSAESARFVEGMAGGCELFFV